MQKLFFFMIYIQYLVHKLYAEIIFDFKIPQVKFLFINLLTFRNGVLYFINKLRLTDDIGSGIPCILKNYVTKALLRADFSLIKTSIYEK